MTSPGIVRTLLSILVVMGAALPVSSVASDENSEESFLSELPVEMHGFYEMRGGYRLRKDKYEKDMSIMENRFQLDLYSYLDWGDIRFKGDA